MTNVAIAGLMALGHVDELRMLSARREAERAEGEVNTALADLKAFGQRLFERGGEALMVATYDEAVDRFGYRGVFGASNAWSGIGAWAG